MRVLDKLSVSLGHSFFKRILIGIYIFLMVLFGYHMYFAKRIIPGVKIGNLSVGGMSFDQAVVALEAYG